MIMKKRQIYNHTSIQRFNKIRVLFFIYLFIYLFMVLLMFVEMETFISSHAYSNT